MIMMTKLDRKSGTKCPFQVGKFRIELCMIISKLIEGEKKPR